MENLKDKTIEFEGKTFDEAVCKAMTALKVSRDQLNIKLLSEEKKGLFGMAGAKPAKIRVSILSAGQKKKT